MQDVMHDWYEDLCAVEIAFAQPSPQDTPAFLVSLRKDGGVFVGDGKYLFTDFVFTRQYR
jgi:hypothetical protein